MAASTNEPNTLLSLSDCLYFANGNCLFKSKCKYRHCPAAIKQLAKCPNWPESCRNVNCPYRHNGIQTKTPKPLTEQKELIVFLWDIENVPIPRGQRPFDIVQRIRQKLVTERRLQEVDFSCYCNTTKIPEDNQKSLQFANVRIVHVVDGKPGAADRQIMLDLDRFERIHSPPATIVLISGDIDFVGKLSDLRHHAGFHVIVIHNKPAKEELKATVNEHYPWESFTEVSEQQEKKHKPQPQPQPQMQQQQKEQQRQQRPVQPILRKNSGIRLNTQSSDVGIDANVNRTGVEKVKQPLIKPLMETPVIDNLVQNNPAQPIPTAQQQQQQRSGSINQNHRRNEPPQPVKPLIPLPVNSTPSETVDDTISPSKPPPKIIPRFRLRPSGGTNLLKQQNGSPSGSTDKIPTDTNDDENQTTIQRAPIRCPHCTNEFTVVKALRQHQKDRKHLFYCSQCNEGYPTEMALKQHRTAKGHGVSNDTTDTSNTDEFVTQFQDKLKTSESQTGYYSADDGKTNYIDHTSDDDD